MEYGAYLQSNHWKETRTAKVNSITHCQICFTTKKLNVHHKHYERDGVSILFNESEIDLLVLCNSCHSLWHKYIGLKTPRHKHMSKLRRLIRMGITRQKAFLIWSKYPTLYDAIYRKYSYKLL